MAESMMTALVDVEDWRRWRTSSAGRKRWHAWTTDWPVLRAWELDDLASPTGSPRTDAMQAALVGLSQRGEGLAATTLLVQLRPGLARLVRWAAVNGLRSSQEATEEVRAIFFETIYRHSLARRPAKIAANLVLDTRQRLTRSSLRAGPDQWQNPGRDQGPSRLLDSASEVGIASVWDADPLSSMAVSATLQAAVGRLPGSASSRRLTATLAYRAWILEEPRAIIAADLDLPVTMVSKRLHRLRALVRREDLVA